MRQAVGGCGAAEGNSRPWKPFSPTQYVSPWFWHFQRRNKKLWKRQVPPAELKLEISSLLASSYFGIQNALCHPAFLTDCANFINCRPFIHSFNVSWSAFIILPRLLLLLFLFGLTPLFRGRFGFSLGCLLSLLGFRLRRSPKSCSSKKSRSFTLLTNRTFQK